MSAVKVEATSSTTHVGKGVDGPRKRRKRAPVTGAAADCFTCANRKAKCDRRRPYCTTCLEGGQDCAGYKTQLTWGVGVASRGKLRGLSLPVAGTSKVAEAVSTPTTNNKKRRLTPPRTTEPEPALSHNVPSTPLSPEPALQNTFPAQQPTYQHVRNQLSTPRHSIAGSISDKTPPTSFPSVAVPYIDTSMATTDWSNKQAQGMHNPSPISPVSYTATSQHSNYLDYMPLHTPQSYSGAEETSNSNFLPENFSSYQARQELFVSVPTSNNGYVPVFPEDDVEEIKREPSFHPSSDIVSLASSPGMFGVSINWTPLSGTGAIGKTPRMQYLIQYYAEVIAPVIVAFDSPTNPFRDQILNLAAKSDSLQHALSALAASNLRQRKESGALSTGKTLPARRSSAAHLSLTNTSAYDMPIIPARDQRREEVYHKFHAVQSLNAALADPNLLKDDAVLATLLVLCLFHICDSGIARFQTQFAGVKKLLNLRNLESGGDDSRTRWMTRLFTWFDAMAATVNEREGQFGGHILDSSASTGEEWSYETLAGVDGRLFRVMSQLGRLNILSQGKAVESTATVVSRPLPFMNPATTMANPDFSTFDGNGWMRIIDDENFFTMKTAIPQYHDEANSGKSAQFWREWREVRQQLQTWSMDTLLYESSTQQNRPHLTEDQIDDIDNLSNAFRYSALLYTERLGHPTLPSSHERIQFWVRRSLHHIKRVRSDVYLLWPLFITGSECIHEEERDIIRERCEDIQKDSGFVNNASCLALLEKVWKVIPTIPLDANLENYESEHSQSDVNGFRFRDIMQAENNEGEWIVV